MKKHFTVMMLVAGLVLAGAFAAQAQGYGRGMGPCGDPGMSQGRGGQGMAACLNLSPEQQQQVQGIRLKGQEETLGARQRVWEAREQWRTVMHADSYDEQAVKAASAELSAAQDQLRILKSRSASEMRAILSPEQRRTWDANRQDRGGKGGRHHGYGQGQNCPRGQR